LTDEFVELPAPVVEPHPDGDEVPEVVTCAGCAPVPEPAALAWTPQWAALDPVPLELAPAWPVETLVFELGWDELPAETVTGWTLASPGGGLGLVSANTAAAVASVISEASERAIAAGLSIPGPSPVCAV